MDTRNEEKYRPSRRPIRNRRYNRRAYGEDKRPPKRLFTPEIKKFLKDWLVRRRENPYPNREEKKTLAVQTGLTYIQVCNWFANWRRKLKNVGKEPQKRTWGDLIKTYNSQVQGNVEHFSICSDDSIWEEPGNSSSSSSLLHFNEKLSTNNKFILSSIDNRYISTIEEKKNLINNNNNNINNYNKNDTDGDNNSKLENQCCFISSTTTETTEQLQQQNPFSQTTNKYKNHIIEKYLRDCQKPCEDVSSKPSMITKWLESAANFQPSEDNFVHWTLLKNQKTNKLKLNKNNKTDNNTTYQLHGREEIDAAEALTKLANARSFKI